MSVINMRFAEDQRGVILRGQVSTHMKLWFSLNEQHAHHEDSSSKNSVLLHDFCHRVCEAQLTQMAAKFCSFVEYHADVINTTVCCAKSIGCVSEKVLRRTNEPARKKRGDAEITQRGTSWRTLQQRPIQGQWNRRSTLHACRHHKHETLTAAD